MGDGNVDSKILFIGEAPGRDEVKLNKPFVGSAGRRLSEALDLLGVKREEIYITNAIKYRLEKASLKTGRKINRPATVKDIIVNKEYLLKEIDIINPEIIVTLGNVPLKALCGDEQSIGVAHGICKQIELNNNTYRIFPLYHPASMIYNPDLKSVNEADILALKGHKIF